MVKPSLSSERKQHLFRQILDGYKTQAVITRKGLAITNKLRPATVTQLIGEMIQSGIIAEDTINHQPGPGRPEVGIIPDFRLLTAIFICIDARNITASLVDIRGVVLAGAHQPVHDDNADSETLLNCFRTLISRLLQNCRADTRVQGIIISLPGVMDAEHCHWLYTNRWPKARHMDLSQLAEEFSIPVCLVKNLQAELNAFVLENNELSARRVLYVHWGEGIGAASYSKQQINANQQGLFGELGQLTFGNSQTIEQMFSLSALRGVLSEALPGDLSNERAAAKTLQHADITAIPCLKNAADIWSRLLANIYFILFPDVIIFSGPFTHNEALFREITTGFSQHVPDYFEQNVTFTINHKSYMNEMNGALSPFFDALVAEYCCQES
ncbi:ROK family protein [Morganella morganii]|uniref:ROK family protein n=1 Tax=Morganella morganii TaxID=582 RepID=UPI0011650AB1|nr:ROK family protein [Morganella morganii]QQO74268.1 ROK family protein [Morganella morganii]